MELSAALFDTNILIDFLRQIPEAQAELHRYEQRFISRITWMEVMAGVRADEDDPTRLFLTGFTVLDITNDVVEQAFVLRRIRKLKLPDALIKATADVHRLVMVTRNIRDFAEGPSIRVPYRTLAS